MFKERRKKVIALFFLMVLSCQLFAPLSAFALTSGPSQPEMAKFEPAGANDLVDLFTGDLKYNIPLLDVGGYPVNLSYNSGTGMEDEASWVGTGWTLNPGAVNRTMRGLPDDFNGATGSYSDKVTKTVSKKEFKKVGATLIVKPSLFGWEFGKANMKVNIYKDNYYGIGASVGAGVDFSLATNTKTKFTAGMGLDINSDVRNGVDVSPNLSLSMTHNLTEDITGTAGLSGSLTYNTRGGLKSTSLGLSYSTSNYDNGSLFDLSYTKYFGQPYPPVINMNTVNNGFSFSLDGGIALFGGYVGIGGTGSFYQERLLKPTVHVPAFGYMNYLKGRANTDALLDFNREKDGVFLRSSPAIATPVATHDFFTATSQTGSQQFRPYFGGTYVVFDRLHTNKSLNLSGGLTAGGGNLFKAGARVSKTTGGSETRKWTTNNLFLNQAEPSFPSYASSPDAEVMAMRQQGEHTRINETGSSQSPFFTSIGKYDAKKVSVAGGPLALASLKDRDGTSSAITLPMKKESRDNRTTTFSYLTAEEASKYGLEKTINGASRYDNVTKKAHHISEVTVTDNEGKRMVYGIPVYNNKQSDVSFAVKKPATESDYQYARKTGIIEYNSTDASSLNKNGRDWYYSKETTPGYATSFLLTAILSPDYVDKGQPGITDDDLGTAIKFNYNKHSNDFKWRAPYDLNKANYNEGFLSDPKDDKANYVYGEKEVWYLQSIESKTMIAFFDASVRQDALGVLGETGGKNVNQKLLKLDKIRLYSKADWVRYQKNQSLPAPVPVKEVYFEYDYSLYPGVSNNSAAVVDKNGNDPAVTGLPNVNAEKGKLTLKKVYFKFGGNSRGASNPYEFEYDMRIANDGSISGLPKPANSDQNHHDALEGSDKYTLRQTDRWGVYKQSHYNRYKDGQARLNNSEFPYSLQKNYSPGNVSNNEWSDLIDRFASKWQLNKITTPTNSVITAEYESDDYAFVQSKRAMQMCFIKDFGNDLDASDHKLTKANRIVVELPFPVATEQDFKNLYLKQPDGNYMSNIFYKIFTDIDGKGHKEFVHGYAEIDYDKSVLKVDNNDKTWSIPVKKIGEHSPMVRAAWQMLRTDLPQYAYDNYDNSDVGTGEAAIRSLIAAFLNIGRELFRSFEERAEKRHYAENVDFNPSMVRLCSPGYTKMISGSDQTIANTKTGGGCRVKIITISDQWQEMVAAAGSKTAKYGQVYDYTMKDNNGNIISSGVAAYEPQIGNEENPFHEPVNFTEKVHWSSDRYHYIEKPYCETYFPGASVGYNKVTVTSFGDDYANGASLVNHTGQVINEFYTAKDFPTIVENLTMDQVPYETNTILQLFTSTYIRRMVASQGFKVELNDMHGKPKKVQVLNKGGDVISSSEYFYNVKDQDAEFKELSNQVDVLEADGSITKNITLATEIDFTADVRQSTNESIGTSAGVYNGAACYVLFCVPNFGFNYNQSVSRESFNSISTVKVIHRFGILKRTRTMQNGSYIESENLLWDGETGSVVLTKTQNEYDQHTYVFNYAAYKAIDYKGMGAAYKNLGATFADPVVNTNGRVKDEFIPYFFPGDEVVNLQVEQRAWVIKAADGTMRFVDKDGDFTTASGIWRIIRSGRRNLLGAGAGTVICMKDPRVNNRINLEVDERILDSKAVIWKEDWALPVNNYTTTSPGFQGTWMCKGVYWNAFTKALFKTNPATGRYYLLSYKNDNVKVGDIIRVGITNGYFSSGSTPLTDFFYPCAGASGILPDVDQMIFYLGTERQTGGDYYTLPNDLAYFETVVGETKINSVTVGASIEEDSFTPDAPLHLSSLWSTCSKDAVFDFPSTSSNYNNCLTRLSRHSTLSIAMLGFNYLSQQHKHWDYIRESRQRSFADTTNVYDTVPGGKVPCTFSLSIDALQVNVSGSTVCNDPVDHPINPYYTGVLGNWRPYVNYVYTVNREQKPGNNNQVGGTDLRNSGYYKTYSSFWSFAPGGMVSAIPAGSTTLDPVDTRWIWSNKSVYYDQKGNEIENVDALNRYGSALFGYQQSLAIAVGANARHNEIAFDGFEDYDFDLSTVATEACPLKKHFDFGFVKQSGVWTSPSGTIDNEMSHTGKYSYKITGNVNVTGPAGNAAPIHPFLGYDNTGRYKLLANEPANGFAPVANKKYLLSFWINDNSPLTNTVQNLQVKINGQTINIANIIVPVVEGWKRLEIPFTHSGNFQLEFLPSASAIWVDDFRILPDDGQLGSYVYDDVTLRLVAQLDENNFATYYEYDDEGTPVRVKKETERGIMTLKENRQSFRKRQ